MSRLIAWNSALSITAAGIVCVPLVDGTAGAGGVLGGGGAGAAVCGPGADEVDGPATVCGLTDKKAIAISSILEVLIDGAVAEDEGIMYTSRIRC
ncbi:hypothetical protein NDU88_003580 [Pleurodeles waltl]|uniref:Secreted protein n=1 Tax=Pleurodeles waltl TaxID=8319 RepID=A0AAV7T6W3_PLEWA|nr:hypothetical protein NDU88_003580 [Pleurodeles waltl]